jgi:hypothetical protein
MCNSTVWAPPIACAPVHASSTPTNRTCSSGRRVPCFRVSLDHSAAIVKTQLVLVITKLNTRLLRPVSDQLEPANDLADGEEANDLGDDDADGRPLGARHAADLRENVLGLHAVGLGRDAVHERAGVAEHVQRGLDVVLHRLNGAVAGQ